MKKIFFLFFIFLPALLPAQVKHGQPLIDSLVNELNSDSHRDKEDTANIAILNDICHTYYNINPDKGIQYGKQGLLLAEKLNCQNYIAQINYYLGANYCVKGVYPDALDCWLKALKIFEDQGNKRWIGKSLKSIGRVFVMQKQFDHALEYYNKALSVLEELKDTLEVTHTLGDMGSAYAVQKDYAKALDYYNQALNTNLKLNNKDGIADNTGNLGYVYMKQHDYVNALDYLFKALKMNEDLGDKSSSLINTGNIAQCYIYIAKDTNGKIEKNDLIPKGKVANLQKAIEYFKNCIKLCKETGELNSLQNYLEGLSESDELLGNYKAALDEYKQFIIVKDSVFNLDNNEKITNLETQRDLELKQKDIELDKLAIAKKRNESGYFIAGIVLLTCVIGVVFRSYKIQQGSNALLTQANSLLNTEKNRSDDLLRNILPSEVAEELKNKGSADAKLFEDVTVLFTDFVSFTKVTELLSPKELVTELHTCFKTFDEITGKYGIEKIKTIGDAYLAVCGLPVANPKHAENTVRAALEISAYMRDRYAKLGDKTFEVRIGIHSGSVVAGIVGVKKFAYDIWGDAVNTAARMEQNSAPGKINISETTYELVKDHFNCEYRGEIDAKNKGAMKMYFVNA